jgi:hypothetical protein
MPASQNSSQKAKSKKLRGGSAASDAVVKLVPAGTFEQMNQTFSNDFAGPKAGGATANRKKKASGGGARKTAPKVDMNASAPTKMLVHNKKGGAYGTSIGKMEAAPYKIPQTLPDGRSGLLSYFTEPNPAVVPYPQYDLASKDLSGMDPMTSGGAAPRKTLAKSAQAKSKAKSKSKA